MNAKDIAWIRRHIKPDHDALRVFDILHVYIMKESSEIYHYEAQPFAFLEKDQQELFMGNFRKLLSGRMDEKLFELRFQGEAEEDHAQPLLLEAMQAKSLEDWKDHMLRLVSKMLKDDHQFGQDTVITFIRGEYFKPTKQRSEESEESEKDEVYAFGFILCTINKTEQPPKSIVFDYVSREFRSHVAVDPIIKLASPEGGFLFPCITDDAMDVNHILYASGKAHEPDMRFIEDVLNGELRATARQDKAVFEEIVREVAGDELEASTLAHVYEEIHRLIEDHEEEEPPKLDVRDVERILTASGVEDVTKEKVELAFRQVVDDEKYELKATSVLPKFEAKSIRIETKVATISISPQDLRYVRQVRYQGKRCILIEVDEDAVIEGFTMRTETLM
jgi:hypothetical protein